MNYAKITDFENAGQLAESDKFLIARAGGSSAANRYVTYSTTFQQLSGMLKEKISTIELQQTMLTSLSQCTATATTSAVAGNVMYTVNQKTDSLSSGTLLKSKASTQTVTGPVSFTGSLSAADSAVDSSHTANVVNVGMLKSYVDGAIRERPLFSAVIQNQALNNRKFILTDIVPNAYAHTSYTLVLKYKLKAETSKTVLTKVYNNGTEVTGVTISGQADLKLKTGKNAVDQSWFHVRYYLDKPSDGALNQIYWTLHNGNYASVDVAMSIHVGHFGIPVG